MLNGLTPVLLNLIQPKQYEIRWHDACVCACRRDKSSVCPRGYYKQCLEMNDTEPREEKGGKKRAAEKKRG